MISTQSRTAAVVLVVAALLAVVPFVDRGWIPHDEGMIGQTAARVLASESARSPSRRTTSACACAFRIICSAVARASVCTTSA